MDISQWTKGSPAGTLTTEPEKVPGTRASRTLLDEALLARTGLTKLPIATVTLRKSKHIYSFRVSDYSTIAKKVKILYATRCVLN